MRPHGEVDINALYNNRAEITEVIERYRGYIQRADDPERIIYERFLERLEARRHDIDHEIQRREGKA